MEGVSQALFAYQTLPVCSRVFLSPQIMSAQVDPIVSATWLKEALQNSKTRVFDVAHIPGPQPNYEEFKEKHFAKFKELSTQANEFYSVSHIPGSAHFSLYVGQTVRHSLYPPSLFEEYVRPLGVNKSEHITIVGRGPAAGMLYAARVWWLFRVYGHESVSVLDGGLDAWLAAGYPVDDKPVSSETGNWKAKKIDETLLATFGEIDFHNLDQVNYLDGRPRSLFEGTQPQVVSSSMPLIGAHVKGAKSVFAEQFIEDGHLVSVEKINNVLSAVDFDASKTTITACNTGMKACLLALALYRAGHVNVRVYNGGLFELAQVAPELISEM